VPLLVEHFLRRFGKGQGYSVPPEVMTELSAYRWPGNVRELENAIERAVALAPPNRVLSRDVLLESALGRRRRVGGENGESGPLVPLKDVVREAEARHVRRVLASCEGRRAQAAKVLGISRKNLWEKMKEYGIE
jgi:DNA-binding NtrC family response regulator